MKKHFPIQHMTAEQIAEFLRSTDNVFYSLTNEDFGFLLTLFTIYPAVAEAFFTETLKPLAHKTAKDLNSAYPMIHFKDSDVASMTYTRFVQENMASLNTWNGECHFVRWLNIIYPQRCKEALRQMGIKTKTSRSNQKSLRLKLLSYTVEERLFIIDHLDDQRMKALLTYFYVDRYSTQKIEELTGMDAEEQNATLEAAANCLRVIVDEYRGALYYSHNGVVVNLAAKLFPEDNKNEELSACEIIRIDDDNDENFNFADEDDGDDELSEFLREYYPHLNFRAACNQFVNDCADKAQLTAKEAFIWNCRMENLSSADIVQRYEDFCGKRILTTNIDNTVKVARKKIIAIINNLRNLYLRQSQL